LQAFVAQWIELSRPKGEMGVRFPPRAPKYMETREPQSEIESLVESANWPKDFDFGSLSAIPSDRHSEVAEILFAKQRGDLVAEHLEEFQGVDRQSLAERLVNEGMGFSLAGNLDKFQNLPAELAYKLAETGYVTSVQKHLDKFDGLDNEKLQESIDKVVSGK
jgi:hypothetical protein